MDGIEKTIRETLKRIDQFTTPEGLFKTYRIDYSEKDCPNDYIDESGARFIDTKYDHAFILDILFRLREYFPSEEKFLDLLRKGLKLIMDDAVITEQTIDGKHVKTLQWRHYNIPHKNGKLILTDIDNTGRRLMILEKAKIYSDKLLDVFANWLGLLKNEDNYKQFWPLLNPVNDQFKPCKSKNSEHSGLFTHFGNKPTNDVDPICNMMAINSTLLFFDRNINSLTDSDTEYILKISDYLAAFMNSDRYATKVHEYYKPIVVVYNYSKLLEFYKSLGTRFKFMTPNRDIERRLIGLILDRMKNDVCENVLEKAFSVTSLIILGYKGPEIEDGINYIIKKCKPNFFWDAYRFYRQRHPYRIFGSRGMTTVACLETLDYWKKSH